MKPRQLIILFVLVAVLAGLIWVKKGRVPAEVAEEEYSTLAIRVDTDKVIKLDIGKGAEEPKVSLIKENGVWVIPAQWNVRVAQNKMDIALAMVKELNGELRGRDEALLVDFGIADDMAYYVKLRAEDDSELLHLLMGKEQPRYSSSFVRAKGSNDVYLVDYNLLQTFGINQKNPEDITAGVWADLSVADFNTPDIGAIRLDKKASDGSSASVVELTRVTDEASGRGRWTFTRPDLPFPPDADKVTHYLERIKALSASAYHDPQLAETGFNPVYLEAMLTAKDASQPYVFTVGTVSAEDASGRYLRVSGQAPVFTLSNDSIQVFETDESSFFPSNPLGVIQDKLASITIHSPSGDEVINAEQFEEKKDILETLAALAVVRLLTTDEEKGKVKESGDRWIQLAPKEGEPLTLDIGDELTKDAGEYAAQLRNKTAPFSISKETHQKIFPS